MQIKITHGMGYQGLNAHRGSCSAPSLTTMGCHLESIPMPVGHGAAAACGANTSVRRQIESDTCVCRLVFVVTL